MSREIHLVMRGEKRPIDHLLDQLETCICLEDNTLDRKTAAEFIENYVAQRAVGTLR